MDWGFAVFELIVHSQFFTLLDSSKRIKIDSMPENYRIEIRVAGVVHPLGSTAPYRSVQ
jgi:hypothetical protein